MKNKETSIYEYYCISTVEHCRYFTDRLPICNCKFIDITIKGDLLMQNGFYLMIL